MTRKMKDSGIEWIGEIPEDWKLSKIKYVTKCFDGRRIPVDASLRIDGIYPYWGAGSIQGYVNDYIFDEEIVLLGEDGAPFFDKTRDVAFLINEKIWVNNHIHVLKGTLIKNEYLVYFLNIVDYTDYINGSILNKLTQGNMKSISIVYPPTRDQINIIELLKEKTSKIEEMKITINKEIQTLEEYKKSVITEAVTKGLDKNVEMKDSGIEWIGEIPKHWKLPSSKYHINIFNGSDPKSDGDIPVYGSGEGIFKYSREYKIGPAVLLGRKGTIEIPKYIEGKYWNVDTAFDVKPKKTLNIKYYYYLSKIFDYKKYITSTALPSMTKDNYANMRIPYPCFEEQNEIEDYLDKKTKIIDETITAKQKQLEILEEYKKSLIYEYVTGKKEVEDVGTI